MLFVDGYAQFMATSSIYFPMTAYLVPGCAHRCELVFLNSRFIASAAPAFSVDEARHFIAQIRARYPDATHNVPAYLIGFGASVISHCNDDGEPAGTAGRPILSVLSGSGLGDIVVVVTRYFGGTKLGTSGLVRAYRESARQVIEELPRARKISHTKTILNLEYQWYEKVRSLIIANKGQLLEQDFGTQITITTQIPTDLFEDFQRSLFDLTRGSLHAIPLSNDEIIVPLEEKAI